MTTDLEVIKAHPRKFVWGRVMAIYELPRYAVVGYVEGGGDLLHENYLYHPYVDGVDMYASFFTLEDAFVHAFARGAHSDPNRAEKRAECACILLRSEP